jgi:signal recognition particle GTPase
MPAAEQPLQNETSGRQGHATPFIIMIAGVNGAGKTTSIGKLAKHFQQQGTQRCCWPPAILSAPPRGSN